MKTKYRLTPQFSVNAENGFPEINYMLEEKKGLLGRWTGVQMFVTKDEAERELKVRTLTSRSGR